ncbi:E3 ubiquitin-protein ligase Siah2-like isoform X1 [Etheostoma cragini]|uniref:E3 ubiquitin-protein ligase Siah2-like isoform X1 n=1 Tax=Etheostoma cragini TaxID=417921 RepID=UPI00155E3FDD|nr:E3 ubiquitin-protein ligase Siah2-like isoform X1 [Etheostoma cragini]
MTLPFTGNGPQLEDMSRPSPDGAGGGGLGGAGKGGGGKHGGSGGAAAAVTGVAAGVSSVSGSAAPSPAVSLAAVVGLPGQSPELTALFECPVCFDYVLPPILQCQAGHLVCNLCRQKLSCCPTCRGPLTPSIRNLAMEKVASTLPFPCKVKHRQNPR